MKKLEYLQWQKTALMLRKALKKAEQEKWMSLDKIKECEKQVNEGLNRINLLWQKK